MATKIFPQERKVLVGLFSQLATEMLDIKYLYKTIQHGVGADIKVGDYLITTRQYDSSIFYVPPLLMILDDDSDDEETSNPYQEWVVDSSVRDHTRKATREEIEAGDARQEKRVKVQKLNLLDWDSNKNTYPIQSNPIVIRQIEINYGEEFYDKLFWVRERINHQPIERWHKDNLIQLQEWEQILMKLTQIPPFVGFYDKKYGLLVKRALRPARIVLEKAEFNASDIEKKTESILEENREALAKIHQVQFES